MKRLGIRTMQGTVQPRERRGVPLFDTESPRLLPNPKIPGLLRSAFRYARLRKQYPGLFDPGHHNMAAHLAMPFDEWLAKHNVAELEPLFACWTSGFGYGPNSRIPAAYGLKFCHPAMLWRIFFLKGGRCFTEGYQNLWTRVAAELDVRLNHRVSSITRGDRVIIRTGAAEHEFDKVVMACDLRAIAPALDTDPEEAELISKIRSHRYHVMVAEVTGLPVRIAFVPGHFREHRKSGLLCWYHRWKEKNLHTLYAISDEETPASEVHEAILETTRRLGGTIGRVEATESWSYFPRVSADDLAAGFYQRLEARQGMRHTFYAGEIMNFSSVDLTAEYAVTLAERHFAG